MERDACERAMLLPAVCHPSFFSCRFLRGSEERVRHAQRTLDDVPPRSPPRVSAAWASRYLPTIQMSLTPSRLCCSIMRLVLLFVCLFVCLSVCFCSSVTFNHLAQHSP